MRLDFIIDSYRQLLKALFSFHFITFVDHLGSSLEKQVVFRHDVDLLPESSLRFAHIQHHAGIRGTYFFRIVPVSFQPRIIEQIAALGHEIGYHYEDASIVAKQMRAENGRWRNKDLDQNEVLDRAIESFSANLATLRKYADIKTICMHGNPLSRWDNRLLWSKYDYRDFGLIGEPYFDIDFNKVAYYTDTGRRWDGHLVSIRDKVDSGNSRGNNDFPVYRTTFDIIRAAEQGTLPQQVMFTFHPQRWTNRPLPWVQELVWQNVKNVVKWGMNVKNVRTLRTLGTLER